MLNRLKRQPLFALVKQSKRLVMYLGDLNPAWLETKELK